MEGNVITDPVPAGEELEITSIAEPTTSNGSVGGDGGASCCPWSLTFEQQVDNFKENWSRVTHAPMSLFPETSPTEISGWFERVVSQLRVDPCLDRYEELENHEFAIDGPWTCDIEGKVTMTSLGASILIGDLKMVQKVLETRSGLDNVKLPLLLDDELRVPRSSGLLVISHYYLHESFWCTHVHMVVACGDIHIVNALLNKGADVNARNSMGHTPLDLACLRGDRTMLNRLLENDRFGKGPFHVAVQQGEIDFIRELPFLNVNAVDYLGKTPLHYLATTYRSNSEFKSIVEYLAQHEAFNLKALDDNHLSPFYLAVLCCNTELVSVLLDSYKEQIRLNEACDEDRGPPIQIAFEGGDQFKDIERALMECDPVKGYMERLYRDRQVYVDVANAILVGAALIASVTFASWLQPPLNYTTYFGEGYSSSSPTPSTSDLNYANVEHNIALRAFWIFNALSFYFAIATVVCGARSVLPRSHLFIKKTVEKLRTNLLVTSMSSILLACSMLFVIIAFAIAGTIVLTPLLKYQWFMIVPTLVGGMVCIVSLVFWAKSMAQYYFKSQNNSRDYFIERLTERLSQKDRDYLEHNTYYIYNYIRGGSYEQ